MKIKIYILTLLSLQFLSFINGKNPGNTIKKEMNIMGKVKSVKETAYQAEVKFGIIEKGNKTILDRDFGGFGYEKDIFLTFNYNENVEVICYYERDGALSYKDIYSYDENSYLIEINRYHSDGALTTKFTYKYDDNKNPIEMCNFNSKGKMYVKKSAKYDDKGNLIEYIYGLPDGSFGPLSEKLFFKYNEDGYKIQEDRYIPLSHENGGGLYTDLLKYDNKGNLIEKKHYRHGNLTLQDFFKYDENNNIIQTFRLNDYKKTYDYVYDDKGNWIKRIEYVNGIPKYILVRELEYY
jgi:hypothetical protein